MSKIKNLLLIISLPLFFAGCAASLVDGIEKKDSCSDKIYNSSWVLYMIDNNEIDIKNKPYIKFYRDGRVGGYSGCNSFFGNFISTQNEMDFFSIGGTRRYCKAEEGEIERALFSMLNGKKWWQFDKDNDLVIFDEKHRLIFKKSNR